jgi:hypothetical protein
MNDVTHTIVSLLMLIMAHWWGYWRAAAIERTEGVRECLLVLQEMGVIGNFNVEVEEIDDDE